MQCSSSRSFRLLKAVMNMRNSKIHAEVSLPVCYPNRCSVFQVDYKSHCQIESFMKVALITPPPEPFLAVISRSSRCEYLLSRSMEVTRNCKLPGWLRYRPFLDLSINLLTSRAYEEDTSSAYVCHRTIPSSYGAFSCEFGACFLLACLFQDVQVGVPTDGYDVARCPSLAELSLLVASVFKRTSPWLSYLTNVHPKSPR